MAKLYQNQILYCKNGDTVVVVEWSEKDLWVLYKGKRVKRPIEIIGDKLFFCCPPGVKINRSTSEKAGEIKIGSKITLENINCDERLCFEIIASHVDRKPQKMGGAYYGIKYDEKIVSDAKPQEGTISDQSPIGKAVIGRFEGDEFSFCPPQGGVTKYRIIEVK